MNHRSHSPVVPLLWIAIALSSLAAAAWLWGADHLDWRLVAVAGLCTSLDFADLLFRMHLRRAHQGHRPGPDPSLTSAPLEVGAFSPAQVSLHLQPYAIVVSVHNAEAILDDFLEAVAPYRNRVWVIDDASTDETVAHLQRAGIRCLRGGTNRRKPGALRELIATVDPDIATIVVLDPDSRFLDSGRHFVTDIERVVFEFQRSGMAAVCPCLTVRDNGLLGRLQQLEYFLSFDFGRRSLYDHSITSGIAIYRRDAITSVLARSSSVYAEDLKNALLLLGDGERIYYDGRLVVETAGPTTWAGWFSQRVGWYFGLLKVYLESLPSLRRWCTGSVLVSYHFVFYTGVVGIVLQPVRVAALVLLAASAAGGLAQTLGLSAMSQHVLLDPRYFLLTYGQGTLMILIALAGAGVTERRELWTRTLPVVPLYPLYALLHTVPITVGYLNWITLRLFGRRLYRDHFQDDESLRRELCRVV